MCSLFKWCIFSSGEQRGVLISSLSKNSLSFPPPKSINDVFNFQCVLDDKDCLHCGSITLWKRFYPSTKVQVHVAIVCLLATVSSWNQLTPCFFSVIMCAGICWAWSYRDGRSLFCGVWHCICFADPVSGLVANAVTIEKADEDSYGILQLIWSSVILAILAMVCFSWVAGFGGSRCFASHLELSARNYCHGLMDEPKFNNVFSTCRMHFNHVFSICRMQWRVNDCH